MIERDVGDDVGELVEIAPSGDCWPNSRASMPSTAFIAMRTRNMIGSSRNGHVAADSTATNAPIATDIAAVSTVT
jgi:hypothetical protein